MCFPHLQRKLLESIQGAVQGGKPLLPHRDSRLGLGRIPIPLGKRRKVRLLARSPRGRTQIVPTIPHDLEHYPQPVREDYRGYRQHYRLVRHGGHGQTS